MGELKLNQNKESYDDLELQTKNPGDLAQSLLDEGIKAMKIWPFDEFAFISKGQMISSQDLKKGLDRIKKIRDAVGSNIDILGAWSIFSCFSSPTAARFARQSISWCFSSTLRGASLAGRFRYCRIWAFLFLFLLFWQRMALLRRQTQLPNLYTRNINIPQMLTSIILIHP